MKRCSMMFFVAVLVSLVGLGLTEAIAAEGKHGGTLIMITQAIPRHFNGAVQSGLATAVPSTKIFASPLRFDENWNIHPYLAKSWKISEDGLSVTLNLVENATFHDGKPVTSEDVAFTIMTSKGNHPFKTMFAPVEKIDTPDPHTAVIRLSKPHPAILLALSPPLCPVLPKHIFGDGQDPKTHPMNLKPIGSGPFKFVEYKPQQYLILERNENHFLKDRPYVDKIIIKYAKDPSNRMMVMERKEAHLYFVEYAPQNLLRFKKMKHLVTTPDGYTAIGPINWVAFNLRREPLNNVKVRKAIAYAIDRDFITQTLYFGLAVPATGPIVPGSPYYSEDVEKYDRNLEKANALLDEAGYPRDSSGKRFSVTMDWEPGMVHRMIAESAKSQLEEVGIEVKLRPTPDFPAWAKRVSNWDFDLTVDNVWNWGDPVIGVHRTYISDNIRHVIWSNTQGYSNPKVDEMLARAAVEMDMAKRKAIYAEFSKLVVDELPIYYLVKVPFHTVHDKNLRNVVKSIWGVMAPMDTIYFEK